MRGKKNVSSAFIKNMNDKITSVVSICLTILHFTINLTQMEVKCDKIDDVCN